MRLIQFINNRTEELMAEQETFKTFSLSRDAESEALRTLLALSRWTLKWSMFLKVVFQFLGVQLKLKSEPKALIAEKKKLEHNAKLKKIGMKQLK